MYFLRGVNKSTFFLISIVGLLSGAISCVPSPAKSYPPIEALADSMESAYRRGDEYQGSLFREQLLRYPNPDSAHFAEATVRMFDMNRLVQSGALDEAEIELENQLEWVRSVQMDLFEVKLIGLRGNLAYFRGDYESARLNWLAAVDAALRVQSSGMSHFIASVYSNLGILALDDEQYKTAINYFQGAQDRFLKSTGPIDNYWMSMINEAVCRIILKQYDIAAHILIGVDSTSSTDVALIYHMNQANLGLAQKDSAWFSFQMEATAQLLQHNPNYTNTLAQLWFEGGAEFGISQIPDWVPDFDFRSLELSDFSVMYHLYQLKIYGEGIYSAEQLLQFLDEDLSYDLRDMIYKSLIQSASKTTDLSRLVKLQEEYADFLNEREEHNLQAMQLDFESYERLRELTRDNESLLLENDIKTLSLSRTSWMLWIVSLLMAFMVLWYVMYRRIVGKRRALELQEATITKLKLQEAQREREEMDRQKAMNQRKLKRTSQLIHQVQNMRDEIMSLHKMVADVENNPEDLSQRTNKLKMSFNSLFAQYSDFTMDIMSDGRMEDYKAALLKKFPELKDREATVAALIALDFSTTDIAKNLSRSVKNIEYQRTILRKKLNIDPEITLNDFMMEAVKE